MNSSLFDLEKAIAAWRRPFEHRRAFSREDLDELEVHLRAHVAELRGRGRSEQAAFGEAVRGLGDLGEAEAAYRRVYWGKVRRRHQLTSELHWRLSMLTNNLKIALRTLRRHPGYTFINIAGLAVGMVCCLLIGLYAEDELSFDRFHEKADRLFTVFGEHPEWGRSLSTPYGLASALETRIPDIERTTRVWDDELSFVREETGLRSERSIVMAEPAFFEMFSFPAVVGDPANVLNTPDGAVITESMARAFFGEDNPIGKTLAFELHSFMGIDTLHAVTIGAVVKDVPRTSSIRFDLAAPLSLLGDESFLGLPGVYIVATYVQTTTVSAVEALNRRIAESVTEDMVAEGYSYGAIPLTDLHLSGLTPAELAGQPKYLYVFGSVALVVLLIAAVNYVSLVTAQGMQRAREVGVRKTLGAGRAQLARQFLGESILVSFAALVLALGLMALALPAFNRLFDKALTLSGAEYVLALPLLCGFVFAVAVVAGAYPAFVLSRFQPTDVLRGAGAKVSPMRGRMLRQSLVVFQFTISAALIIGTAIIYRQLQYVQNKNLGFNGEQVIVVDLPKSLSAPVRETLKQRVVSHPGIVSASVANGVPGGFQMGYGRPVDEAAPQNRTDEERVRFRPAVVDYDFMATLDIRLLAGRGFSPEFPADASRAYVLNKAAVERLGWSPEEAVGQSFTLGPPETPEGEVIGVVDNFHIASLHQEIEPVVLQLHTQSPVGSIPFKLVARLAPEQIREATAHVEQQVGQMAPGVSFRYVFLDEVFDQMYRSSERLSQIFTAFAALAIFIAYLGLFGLAAYTAERRTKEIGIRRAMGATAANIVALLSKDFLRLVLIAFVIAAPLAWFAMSSWLEEFAYRIAMGPGIFLLTGGLVVLIALLAVSYQAIRAALADPVKSLRYE